MNLPEPKLLVELPEDILLLRHQYQARRHPVEPMYDADVGVALLHFQVGVRQGFYRRAKRVALYLYTGRLVEGEPAWSFF